jgi:hypothetical protein
VTCRALGAARLPRLATLATPVAVPVTMALVFRAPVPLEDRPRRRRVAHPRLRAVLLPHALTDACGVQAARFWLGR